MQLLKNLTHSPFVWEKCHWRQSSSNIFGFSLASPLRMFISTCWNKKNEQSFCLYSLFSDPLAVTNYSYAFYTIIFNREWIGKNRTFRIKTQKTDFWKSNTHWYFIEENDRLAFVRRHTCLINFNTILQTWPLSEWC